MNNIAIPVLSIFVILLAAIIVIYNPDLEPDIVTGKAYTVTGGASEYTCVISESESDNELLLNCLEIK